ncbi:MAG: HEPN domain-containing protein [Bacteroidota bacterium]
MDEKIIYWKEMSDYDIETAEAMLLSKRYLYVGFMCHQAIEKIFKAFYIKNKNKLQPYTHNLSYIAKKGEFYNLLSEQQKDLIDTLEPLNIEARYPSHKERLFKSLNENKCNQIIKETKNLKQWTEKMLLK